MNVVTYAAFSRWREKAQKSFHEEYMIQYSWAEVTLGRLINMM